MTSIRDLFLRAAEAHQAGRLDEAQAGYEAALALAPADPNVLANFGTLCLQRGRLAEGLALIDRSLAERPHQPDAIANRAAALAMLGRLDEALEGLRSAGALGPGGVSLCVQVGDGLRQAGDRIKALEAYDLALRWRPDDFAILHNRSVALMELQRYTEALPILESLAARAPANPDVRFNHGVALHELHRFQEALQALDAARALGADPAAVDGAVGRVWRELGLHEPALAAFERSLAARPDVSIHVEQAVALWHANQLEPAEAALRAALALDPADPYARSNLAVVLFTSGRMAEGWPLYEDRWKGSMKDAFARLPQPVWSGQEPVAGKTVLLWAEQGLGDTLQFVRYARFVAERGARVILAVQPPLAALCRSVAGVAEVVPDTLPPPAFDLCCPLLSLPFALDMADIPNQTPYLHAPADRVRAWVERLGPASRKRVGLVWSGGVRPGAPGYWSSNTRRNIALPLLAPLAQADVDFISLQKGEPAESELAALVAQGWDGPAIADVSSDLHDFADTAALAQNLDLVIAVDTSTAHLAGALGKPLWLLNRFDTDWRWGLGRSDNAWYPTARVFRQRAMNDWTPVIAEVVEALKAFAAG